MECTLDSNGNQELLCRDTPLCSPEGRKVGAVLVFYDVTDLIQAQKNAAWGEVARKLAHSIQGSKFEPHGEFQMESLLFTKQQDSQLSEKN